MLTLSVVSVDVTAVVVRGTRNRTKVLELEGADPQLLLALIGTPAE